MSYTFMCPYVCEHMHILNLAPVCVLVRLGAGVWLLGGGASRVLPSSVPELQAGTRY